jgi:hypothetical protein
MTGARRLRGFLYGIGVAAVLVLVVFLFSHPLNRTPSIPDISHQSLRPNWGVIAKTTGCTAIGPLPDPACTPGDILPENTVDVLCGPSFRTAVIRGSGTTPLQKRSVYRMYGIHPPMLNKGANQVCEIDHLVPLELGGADTIANLWPECSEGYAGWNGAGFREKDQFENYLHREVCARRMSLAEAQIEISTDWFRYWVAAGRSGPAE